MKRIIAATAVAAMLTVTGAASAAKCPNYPGSMDKSTKQPCKPPSCAV